MPRLPAVTEPTKDQQQAYDYLKKTRGAVRGGFAHMLASPDITERISHVGTYVRFESPIPPVIRELAAVAISAEMQNPAEYTAHARQCKELGVNESLLKAVIDRAAVSGANADEQLAIDFARQLARDHKLSDATWQAAVKRLGEKGAVDLVAAIGYYAMLAVCHVALEIKP
jgi:4-carboxymuconolactone decarboxylase